MTLIIYNGWSATYEAALPELPTLAEGLRFGNDAAYGKPVVCDEPGYEGNIYWGWGNLTGEELMRRFWEGAMRGGYVTHGETFIDEDEQIWWAHGGELHGDAPARIAFMRSITFRSTRRRWMAISTPIGHGRLPIRSTDP